MSEPLVHSHRSDELPDDHVLAHKTVYCESCAEENDGEMLHADNNECMQTWVEFPDYIYVSGHPCRNICWRCFCRHLKDVGGVLS